ncbi:MAG: NAD-dependent epimerase/dehydratase family protein [Bacteroidales bacterium]|nr:NAD-dependent epimerase/dehydratase family protein [Bacteroidales bacterium]
MILVTGGTGLLGSHLLYDLLKDNQKVIAIRRSDVNMHEVAGVFSCYHKEPLDLIDRINWVEADMLNYQDMLEVMHGVKAIYHCAAIVSFDPAKRAMMISSNVTGTANIVNAALEQGVNKLVHVSSTSAVGNPGPDQLANESMVYTASKANTGYSISKFRSEMEVWRGIQEGLNAVIVNPSIILGPGFWERGSSSIFTKIDQGLKFYSNGVTGYVGVWDVVRAMRLLMDSGISGERFLVTSENLSYKEVFDRVADALGRRRPGIEGTFLMTELAWRLDWFKSKFLGIGEHTFTSERVRAARNVVRFDNSKIKEVTGMEFEGIDSVIRKVADHYRRNSG